MSKVAPEAEAYVYQIIDALPDLGLEAGDRIVIEPGKYTRLVRDIEPDYGALVESLASGSINPVHGTDAEAFLANRVGRKDRSHLQLVR